MKLISSEFISVLIPIELIFLLTTNTFSGKLKVETPSLLDTGKFSLPAPVGVLNLTF